MVKSWFNYLHLRPGVVSVGRPRAMHDGRDGVRLQLAVAPQGGQLSPRLRQLLRHSRRGRGGGGRARRDAGRALRRRSGGRLGAAQRLGLVLSRAA